MDRTVVHDRNLIKRILQEYAEFANRSPHPGLETIAVFDETNDHYFLHTIGWRDLERIWNTLVYVRIRDGKFWIEIDWTEDGIATALLEAGVPKEDIVLAIHHPSVRPLTEFAVA